ncbi:hypothetical protein ROS9278_01344 [Roseomonas sp. CECT 9278]|nr:hypothetical protein ROS9278_01344 [Roseomonas sp. CECT 9278]
MALIGQAGGGPRIREGCAGPIPFRGNEAIDRTGFCGCGGEFTLRGRASFRIARRMSERYPHAHAEPGVPSGITVVALLPHERPYLRAFAIFDLGNSNAGAGDVEPEPCGDDAGMLGRRGSVAQHFLGSRRGITSGQRAKRDPCLADSGLGFAQCALAFPGICGREQFLRPRDLAGPSLARDVARQRRGARRSRSCRGQGGLRGRPGPVRITNLSGDGQTAGRNLRRKTLAFSIGETTLRAGLARQPHRDAYFQFGFTEATVLGETIGGVAESNIGGAWGQRIGAAQSRIDRCTLRLECPQFWVQCGRSLESVAQRTGVRRGDTARKHGSQD